MALPCYMTLQNASGQAVEGSCAIQGHEGAVLVQAVEHLIELPKNPQTGLVSGKREHLGLKVTKEIDKSSPTLMNTLCSGAQLKSVTLTFDRINKQGKQELYYTIALTNVNVVLSRLWVANCLERENSSLGHMEDISFTYEAITWTWAQGNLEAQDSWTQPK
ncbi:type VI secretion system tube protein TssD [Paraburkholderia sediminicola]|uniref:type VI secretion system tube protein TssD n=1 Tax=Paraburkholderia sediminicola TaxID=458836 RepID=UPI0038B8628B